MRRGPNEMPGKYADRRLNCQNPRTTSLFSATDHTASRAYNLVRVLGRLYKPGRSTES